VTSDRFIEQAMLVLIEINQFLLYPITSVAWSVTLVKKDIKNSDLHMVTHSC